jgi:polyhydroxyalkanoate synthesis regulator phasin
MAEPEDMIVPLVREMRAEIAASRADVAAFRKETSERLEKLEAGQRNLRSAMSGETILGRMLVGEFEERIEALETKVHKLEAVK